MPLARTRALRVTPLKFATLSAILIGGLVQNLSAAPGWTPYSPIKAIAVGSASVLVQLDTNLVTNLNGCANWDGKFGIDPASGVMTSLENARFSAALAARMSGKQVMIYSSACTASGYNNIQALEIKSD